MQETYLPFRLGNYTCTVVSDGMLTNPDADNSETYGLNCLVIETGGCKVLIDTGCGTRFQDTAGHLADNLGKAGLAPGDVDIVIVTHGHTDHVGGAVTEDGNLAFPNARYCTTAPEWAFWVAGPGDNALENTLFEIARRYLVPQRDRFELVAGDAEIVPGVHLVAAPGHSPGHCMVEIRSGGEKLRCIGDIIHSPREFTDPSCLAMFDVDPGLALKTRTGTLAEISGHNTPVFACHFAFPGLGTIESRAGSCRWRPRQ